MSSFSMYFKANGNEVQIWVSPVPTEKYEETTTTSYVFKLDVGNKEFAALLDTHFTGLLRELMEGERERYYEAGWRDAKSRKTKKRDWFHGRMGKTVP